MASDLGGISSLATAQQHTSSSIASLDARLNQLEGYSKDYESLQKKLTQLSQKTKHEIMVPLGLLAFQPGFLHHTNELTVLLGENYFVERSTTQAVDIIKRRLEYLDKQKQNINKQLGNTKQIDTSSRQMFGDTANTHAAKVTASSTDKQPQQPAAASKKAGVDPSLPSELGITFAPDGKMRNEDGDEIVEIKEDYVEEDEVEQKSQSKQSSSSSSSSAAAAASTSASFSLTPSSHPTSSTKISLDGPIDFPSVLDQNFDDFWDSLEAMEKKQEAEEAAAAAASSSVSTNSARKEEEKSSSASSSTDGDSAALRELLPVPSPPLRPISNPADIFRAITEAKIKAGEIIPPAAKPASTTTSASRSIAASPAASSLASSAVETSRSMDAAFAEYKSAKKARKKAAGGTKRVAFADDDSDSEPEIDKGAPIPQSHSPSHPTSILKKSANPTPVKQQATSVQQHTKAPVEPPAERPIPFSSTPGAVAAFSGEIKERSGGAAAEPAIIEKPTAAAFPKPASSVPRPLAGPRPLSTLASASSGAAAAAPQKLSKFKAKMLGLATDDD